MSTELMEAVKGKAMTAAVAVVIAGMSAWGGSAFDGDVPARQVDVQVNERVYAVEGRLGNIETLIASIDTRLTALEKIEREDIRDLRGSIDDLRRAVLNR